jgi:hypothetical protein
MTAYPEVIHSVVYAEPADPPPPNRESLLYQIHNLLCLTTSRPNLPAPPTFGINIVRVSVLYVFNDCSR